MAWDCEASGGSVPLMLTRRRLVEHSAAAAFAAYLAACGEETGGARESAGGLKPIARGKVAESMTFSNWPLYIEEDHGTLKEFEREYGTKVRYIEEISANQEFFGKVRQQYARRIYYEGCPTSATNCARS
jgi:spermidine/putrescine transport system substrate-binding protein